MRKIIFAGSTNAEFGRGKDKKKRKSKGLLKAAGTVAAGAGVGGYLGGRNSQRAYSRLMYESVLGNRNPTNENINAVRSNFLKYRIGKGNAKADVFKKGFNAVTKEGAIKGAAFLGGITLASIGAKKIYEKLKNRKTLKIAGKPIKINGKNLVYNKPNRDG